LLQSYKEARKTPKFFAAFFIFLLFKRKKKTDCPRDNRFFKTNYLKTNLLKQIKKYLLFITNFYSVVEAFAISTMQS